MATVIDALLVTLELDPAGYKKGAAEVTKTSEGLEVQRKRHEKARIEGDKKVGDSQRKRAKEIESYGKKTSDTFAKIRNQALALATVFTAGVGIAAFVKSTISGMANLGRMSDMTGMSVKRLAAWQLSFKQIGGTAEEASSQILKMSNDVASAKAGFMPDSLREFSLFGGDISKVTDVKSYLTQMSTLLQRLKQTHGEQFAFMAAQKMGVSSNMFNVLLKGPDALERQLQANEKLSGATAALAEQMQKMQTLWANFTTTLQNTALTIFGQLQPAINAVLAKLQAMAAWLVAHPKEVKAWVDSAVKAIQGFIATLDEAAKAVGGWKTVLLALVGLKFASAAAGILSLAGGIVKLTAALVGIGAASAGAGMTRLAALGLLSKAGLVAAAGGAGWVFGSWLNKKFVEGTGFGDWVGSVGAHVMSFFGDKTATDAIAATDAAAASHREISGSVRAPRGIRNNNPGNIRYGAFAKAHGATGQDAAGFAIFPTMEAGKAAADALLKGYKASGHDTISKMINRYAPSSENNTNSYVGFVSKRTGIDPNSPLRDDQISMVTDAIFRMENGGNAWSRYASGMPTGARAGRFEVAGAGSNSNTTVSTSIGQITINTQATDAQGIAGTIGPAVKGSMAALNGQAATAIG